MVAQSDWLPMMIATGFPAMNPSIGAKKKPRSIVAVSGWQGDRHADEPSPRSRSLQIVPQRHRRGAPIELAVNRAEMGEVNRLLQRAVESRIDRLAGLSFANY